jgi:FKBP-type peptidyl-prolyl cis-trans isomerase FkpA
MSHMVRAFGRVAPLVALALACAIAGCKDSNESTPTSPSVSPLFTQRDLRIGTGEEAQAGKLLNVHYTGWLFDASKPDQKGLQFETSVGGTPFSFVLGGGEVIQGWDQGIPGMKVGGLRRLVIPSSMAYGGTRSGPIPAFATLVFEIELVEIPVETGTPYSISLRSFSGNFLSVDNNGNANVLANRTSAGEWEIFRLFDVNGGALESGDTVRIETTVGWGFVPSQTAALAAIANPGLSVAQEQFVIESLGGARIVSGTPIALKSLISSFYVSVENGGGGAVNVNRASVGDWETLTLILR